MHEKRDNLDEKNDKIFFYGWVLWKMQKMEEALMCPLK